MNDKQKQRWEEGMKKHKRPLCTAIAVGTGEKCTNPAIFYADWGEVQEAVCGLCARRYIAAVLHPLRLNDWYRE